MDVTMADMNKRANAIINRASESGETVTIYKHGKPIAEIRPLSSVEPRQVALEYLIQLKPASVSQSPQVVVEKGRKRGF